MTRSLIEGTRVTGSTLDRVRFSTGTLADAAQTLSLNQPQVLAITPTAGRVITLPAVTSADNGKFFIITNQAAATHALTINNSAASGIGEIAATETGLVMVVEGAFKVMMVGTTT